jgi:hypothetical protein
MADAVEQAEIRGLDIDKAVKGFALVNYTFKNDCMVSSMSGDSVRWYQETAADLTATAPAAVANISPLSSFANLEVSWTRNTSYVKKFAAEGFLSMEDIKSADIDVIGRTLLRLTRSVTKQVDTAIYNALTENDTPVTINTVATNAAWNTASWTGVDIIEDLMDAKYQIELYNYDTSDLVLYLSPLDYKSLVTWLISSKGSSIPNFASDKVSTGTVMQLLGINIKISPNVTADKALMFKPKTACIWKSFQDITSRAIEEPGIGTKLRVFELGVPVLTNPRCVTLITNTQA